MAPHRPEPIRIEFEVTNICNADCEFCPRFNIQDYGYMNVQSYTSMVDRIKDIQPTLQVYRRNPSLHFPHIVFGGYGEALAHKEFPLFIQIAKDRGLATELITNGALLSQENCKKIVDAGLDKLSISLHTLDSKLNEQIMKRPDCKKRITQALELLDYYPTAVEIWRVGKLDGELYDLNEAPDAYAQFLSRFKKTIPVLGPTPAWNRGGQYDSQFYQIVKDSDDVRCHTMNHTLSVSYNGDIVLCCCDFSLKSVKLAEKWDFDFPRIQEKIERLQADPPSMCQSCRKPKDSYYVQFTK